MLAFTISNQRHPDSIAEDLINKSWRPLPSGRLTVDQARKVLLCTIIIDLSFSAWLGVAHLSTAALILNWMYNDLGGADAHYFIRNLINSLAFVVGCMGTTIVALSYDGHKLNRSAYIWLGIEGAIVLTTLQVQDLRDQEGDKTRHRSTVPVVLGDSTARWSVAVPVVFWSFACPIYWAAGWLGSIAVVSLGSYIALRVLMWRNIEADKATWRLWGLWTMLLFMLPLVHGIHSKSLIA